MQKKRKPFYDSSHLKTVYSYKVGEPKIVITDEDVKKYDNERYELPKGEKLMVDFYLGRRKPQNKEERELYKEVIEIKKSKQMLDFDGEVF